MLVTIWKETEKNNSNLVSKLEVIEKKVYKEINFQLRLNLKGSTNILFNAGETKLFAQGNIAFNLAKKKVYGAIKLNTEREGSLYLAGKGYWDGLEFQTKARINKLNLSLLQGVLGNDSNILTKGDIKGEDVNLDQSGLSKREWNELMIAFDLKDKLI